MGPVRLHGRFRRLPLSEYASNLDRGRRSSDLKCQTVRSGADACFVYVPGASCGGRQLNGGRDEVNNTDGKVS